MLSFVQGLLPSVPLEPYVGHNYSVHTRRWSVNSFSMHNNYVCTLTAVYPNSTLVEPRISPHIAGIYVGYDGWPIRTEGFLGYPEAIKCRGMQACECCLSNEALLEPLLLSQHLRIMIPRPYYFP